jgi:hypothetical protein
VAHTIANIVIDGGAPAAVAGGQLGAAALHVRSRDGGLASVAQGSLSDNGNGQGGSESGSWR